MPEPCRILVVDDEPRGVELLNRTLHTLGAVETALSAEQGWEVAQRSDPHLVISDQRMPGTSGVELLSRIAERGEHTGRILLTGYADLEATIEAINRGRVHAYVTKPCAPRDLRLAARSVLERVRLARENARLLGDLASKNAKLTDTLRSLEDAQRRVLDAERLAAIGRMISMIVHDLRGPLSLIRASGSELLHEAEEAASSVFAERGREVVVEAERMQRMCAELLEVTRASRKSERLVPDEIDEVVHSALAPQIEGAARAGVDIDLQLASGARVLLDEDRLRRAILNLVHNAIDALADGGVLHVVTERVADGVRLSVIDNGPGIPDAIRDTLFEPFVTAGKRGGSGLGLAIVKNVIDDHGGRVEVAKPEGGGTAFHLHLPLAKDPSPDGSNGSGPGIEAASGPHALG